MSVDYPGAIDMMLPTYYSFNTNTPLTIVEHSTGGNLTLDSLHSTFLSSMRSTHFGIDRAGQVAQFVPLARGAGGNCCATDRDGNGNLVYDSYWNFSLAQYGNLNLCTISIEHCNNSSNSLPMTSQQVDASNKLTLWLCQRYKLTTDYIKGHNSINPLSKPFCPGLAFDMNGLKSYVQQNMRNTHMERQMLDTWNQFLEGIGETAPPYDSGIALSYRQHFATVNPGSPLGPEKASVDWSGKSINVMQFAGGLRCEWDNVNGGASWYDYLHRRII